MICSSTSILRCRELGHAIVIEPAAARCLVCGTYLHDQHATLQALSMQMRIDQQLSRASEHGPSYWLAYSGVHPDVLFGVRTSLLDHIGDTADDDE